MKYLRLVGACALFGACALRGADVPVTPAKAAEVPETFAKAAARPVDLAKDRNLYVVGYAHLDTQWRWAYPQVIREYVASTLNDNFTLIEKYPNYVFNFSGSRRYEMMQEYYPEQFGKLREYVAQGRWFPAGSSVDEGDSIVPSAEALVRHVLYGNDYFRREFGVASDEFMLPDCFGFPYALPTVLAHTGVKGFSTQKLTWGSAIGIPFKVGVWEGPDGSSVVAALDPGAYTGKVIDDLSRSQTWLKRIEETGTKTGAFVDYHYYGTGDRGGAPLEDSVKWIERGIAGQGPIRVISSKADQMFKDLKPDQIAKLPRYKGELLLTQHSSGSITSAAYMKRWNRKNELLADAAERAAVAASWLGATPYPARKLYEGWDLLLGTQMHDMLPGTSLPRAYEFCYNDELLAANTFSAVLKHSAGAVIDCMDTQAKGIALVVFNPLGIARQDVVEATVSFPGEAPAAVTVTGPDGRELAAQVVGRTGRNATIVFVAAMPPVAFSTFDVRPAGSAPAVGGELRVSATGLENARYRVTLAPNGDVASIFDKTAGREMLASPARLAFQYHKPKDYPAWNMDWVDAEKPPRSYVEGPAKIRVVESGPVRIAVEIERESEGSRFVQTLRLAAGDAGDRVEFANKIDWQTKESALKAAFPLTVSNPVATYDSQVGTLDRGNNDPKKYEVPQHQWFDLSMPDGSYGVAVLNDSKFGSDKPADNTVRLTLLYTPAVRAKYQDQAVQDFGRHDILYAVAGHKGDWRKGQVPWAGARLNQPLLAFQAPAHAGAVGRTLSLFTVSNAQVSLEAVKKAEASDEIIVRFQELTGRPASKVRLGFAQGISAAREVDGQERPLGQANLQGGELEFDIRGYGLRAFALKLAAPATRGEGPVSQAVALAYDVDVASPTKAPSDGKFDAADRSYPAEQFPRRLTNEGVEFVFGPTADGKPNAVTARGQTIQLPAGSFDQLYLIAAADGDQRAAFNVDGRAVELPIQDWTGFIGQWDTRLWKGEVPEVAFAWFNDFAGLQPAFVKPATVAWYCSHRHGPKGDEHYMYSYLYKYGLPLGRGAKTLTLPNNPRIRIFAVSVASRSHDTVVAATPLFDPLDDHQPGAPKLAPAGTSFDDATRVTIQRPLYWREGGLHYTTDGSKPTAASPVYTGPLTLTRDTVVNACEIDAAGIAGPVATATYQIRDAKPPRVVSVAATTTQPALRVEFSEPVDRASAEKASNYKLAGAGSVTSVKLAADGSSVLVRLGAALTGSSSLTVSGVKDVSPAGNALASQSVAVDVAKPVFLRSAIAAGQGAELKVPGLPAKGDQPWTMNLFVRPTQPIENRTLIAGFGRADNTGNQLGRYFGKFANGVHVWSRGSVELESTTPLADGWQMLTATYDGLTMRLYVNGVQVSFVEVKLGNDEPVVRIFPKDPWDKERAFAGEIRDFAIWDRALSPGAITGLHLAGSGQ